MPLLLSDVLRAMVCDPTTDASARCRLVALTREHCANNLSRVDASKALATIVGEDRLRRFNERVGEDRDLHVTEGGRPDELTRALTQAAAVQDADAVERWMMRCLLLRARQPDLEALVRDHPAQFAPPPKWEVRRVDGAARYVCGNEAYEWPFCPWLLLINPCTPRPWRAAIKRPCDVRLAALELCRPQLTDGEYRAKRARIVEESE